MSHCAKVQARRGLEKRADRYLRSMKKQIRSGQPIRGVPPPERIELPDGTHALMWRYTLEQAFW